MLRTFYRLILKHWNSILAGASVIGVAVTSVVPELGHLTGAFYFLCANAIVWTIIEIKAELQPLKHPDFETHENMRVARESIVSDIRSAVKSSRRAVPVDLTFIGGRLRSMSDIIREIADDFRSGRLRGHARFVVYSLSPEYVRILLLPGARPDDEQHNRNSSSADTLSGIAEELRGLRSSGDGWSMDIEVRHFEDDPHFYCYLIGTSKLYWGPFTYVSSISDFVGPENVCIEMELKSRLFSPIRDWMQSWMGLYDERASAYSQKLSTNEGATTTSTTTRGYLPAQMQTPA